MLVWRGHAAFSNLDLNKNYIVNSERAADRRLASYRSSDHGTEKRDARSRSTTTEAFVGVCAAQSAGAPRD